jgi:hypothetical protein
MALDTNFNVNPYYDDYDEDKKFLRMLFKPGFAVQARELTQLQTILQKQVERFGDFVFKDGSVVTGGQTVFQNTTFINVSSSFAGSAVNINSFTGQTIVDNIQNPTKKATVIKVYDADSGTGDPKTLHVNPIFGTFTGSETILTFSSSPVSANTTAVGNAQIFSVDNGVYYYDGFFVDVDLQTVAVSKYTLTGNARIGFEVTESIVESSSDTSLLDPAQNASNYQAPGADRYKVQMILANRSLTSADDVKFIEVARIENGALTRYDKYPLLSVIEDTLARRTFDESGNYTVKPFKLAIQDNNANTANLDIILSPGKGYVYGYEFETISPTTITFDKPREIDGVQNRRLTADYGYFVFANTPHGSFPINSLQTVDLHCVANASINTTSSGTVSNTKIGTARVKSISFDSAADSANSASYEYKLFLFDVNVGSINGGNTNASISSANTNFVQLANTLGGINLYSTVDNAYRGAKLRIKAGPGTNELPRTITNYNGTTQTVQIDVPFTANVNQGTSNWAIDFEFNDAKAIIVSTGTSITSAMNIDERSKDDASTFDDTFITDTSTEVLVFPLGDNFVANGSISDVSFSYRRLYEGQAFSTSQSPALTVGTGESIASATSTSARAENYQIIVTTQGSGAYAVGQTVPATAVTNVDTVARKITITNANNMTANIIATIDVSNPTQKNKTYIAGNNTVQVIGGINLFGNGAITLYGSQGQIQIAANTIVKTPGTPQSLYTSDVINITSILDFNNNTINAAETGAINVTSRYVLVNGQKDSYYDHAYITLLPGVTAPVGPLVVKFNQFVSSGPGFFTVDSYTGGGYAYEDIPAFYSPNGLKYELRDNLDFRPVRANATVATANSNIFDVDSTTTGPKIPENGSDIILDYNYHLPRNDKIVLNKSRPDFGSFEVIKGISSLRPIDPDDKDNAMTLYILRHQAYGLSAANTSVQYVNNKRYTMRDIGTIEKRVSNMEYYTSLSLLEQDTLNKQDLTILDSANLARFKNGIIVDSFKGHSIADISKNDYEASIDPTNKEMRPSFNISSHTLTFDSANSSNFTQNGAFITVSSTVQPFIDQSKASRVINVNPFNLVNYLGKIELNPKSDIWIDTTRNPDVLVNLEGDKDVWDLIGGEKSPFNYEWNDWNTYQVGVSSVSTRGEGRNRHLHTNRFVRERDVATTTVTTSQQSRTGIANFLVPETITQSIGDKVVDISIIPYMRTNSVLFVATDFKPQTTLFSFFDSTLVESFTARANKVILTNNNLQYQTTIGNFETVTIKNNVTNTTNGSAIIVRSSNNQAFIININPTTSFNIANANLIGSTTSTTNQIAQYEHYSGIVNAATSSTITLRIDASGAANEVLYANTSNSNTIFIVAGTGAGQERTMTSYDAATRTATISSNFTTIPDNTSIYSIGRLTTNQSGDVAGVFTIPASTFRIGEKRFRLIDNNVNDVGASSTNGDASFFAQGLLQKVEETIISATVPSVQRVAVRDERVVQSVTVLTSVERVAEWVDPLAQTFLIAPGTFPNGLFINRVRVCFKTKDDTVPVTIQIRPTVNGYPSYAVIYPYATVTLTPDKVKVTDSPDLDDPNKFTDFIFDTPIYMQPGEHSFVLISNSLGYEVYSAEIGALDLVTGRQISEQPYQGSLFLSQNGSTWTADQQADLSFKLFRNQYSTTPAIVQFETVAPTSNVVFDLVNLVVGDMKVAETSIAYKFNSITSPNGIPAGLKSIAPTQDYEMNDGLGRRVLTTSNNSFTVQAVMATNDPSISPVIDTTRFGIIAVENIINNLPLQNTGFVITNGGSGYANSADVTVTITEGNGSGATAIANVTGSGVIDTVTLTNSGSGYTTSPTITITPGSGGGSGAVVTYNGEDKKSGGNADVRYIARRVTLADGFDSGDLRVYVTAYKPSGSNIFVYYKLLSTSDIDDFDDKEYQLMTQLDNNNFVSLNENDFRELTFAPGINSTANNQVSYTSGTTSYRNFRTFAIKIVLSGTSTVDVPRVRDFRAIALPEGTV